MNVPLLKAVPVRSYRYFLARASVLLAVVVLVCVPGFTRIGQRLETTSHTPSFAKNIDCPPKRMTVAPAAPVATPIPVALDLVVIAEPMPAPDATLPRSPDLFGPRPLRAPPLALLS
jgi:hypothetical protein